MQQEYSIVEYRDMYLSNGKANGSAEEARRFYIPAFSDENTPYAQKLMSVPQFGENG